MATSASTGSRATSSGRPDHQRRAAGQPCGALPVAAEAAAEDEVGASPGVFLGAVAVGAVAVGAGAWAARRAAAMRRLVKDAAAGGGGVALAFVIQASVQAVRDPDASMTPTIEPGDRIIANRPGDIERGDIIVFDPPPSATRECGEAGGGDIPFVKRVIGLPGDSVEVSPEDGTTIVNGEPFVVDGPVPDNYGGEGMTWPVVPEGKLLVLGDNRASLVTRTSGGPTPSSPEDNVIGQAEITYWPLSHLGFLN